MNALERRIVVAGGRDFNDYLLLSDELAKYISSLSSDCEITIVSGKARGADSLGEMYAKENGINLESFPAEWDKFGKSAGYIRNEEMAKYGTETLVFWDGKSKGTKHMIDLSKRYRLPTTIIRY